MVNVKVENFTTYAYAEFKLSPNLNMIIGPNGTGKSTLVAAICLGLGGKIDLIRRKTMKSMIKTGCHESTIKIELRNFDSKPNIIIQRKFTEKSSTWSINDRISDEKTVKSIVKKFNIQLDNLCHFLPQERVAEFATLSPEKLLLETERTLGNGSLLTDHESLMAMDSERELLVTEIDRINSRLLKLKEESTALEEEVKKFKDYEDKTKDIEYHKMLVPYGQFQDMKNLRKKLKEQRDAAKKQIDEFEDKVRPLHIELAASTSQFDQQVEVIEEAKSQCDDLASEFKEHLKLIEETNELIHDLEKRITKTKQRSLDSRATIEADEQELKELEDKLSTIPDTDPDYANELNERRTANHDKTVDEERELRDFERNMSNQRRLLDVVVNQKKSLEQRLLSNDKLEVLQSNLARYRRDAMEKAYRAHVHLRGKPEMKSLYDEAPVVSCGVTDKRFAKYVEKVIDNNTLFSIFCPDRSSFDKISDEVKQFRISLRYTSERPRQPPVPKAQLSEYGFESYLSDFITGPQTVINCLNLQNYLNLIPVSSRPLSNTQFEKLLKPGLNGRIPFMKFIAEDTLFTISRSKYGQKQYIYQTEGINEAQLFGHSGLNQQAKDSINQQIHELDGQLKEQLAEFRRKQQQFADKKKGIDDLRNEFKEMDREFQQIKESKKNKVKLEEVIKSKQLKIQRSKEFSMKNQVDKIRSSQRKLAKLFMDNGKHTQKASEITSKMVLASIEYKRVQFLGLEYKNRIEGINQVIRELDEYKSKLETVYTEAAQKYSESKNNEAHKQIKEQSQQYSPEDRQILADLAADYLNKNVLTEFHIRSKIQLLEDERSVMSVADRTSIESLRKKLEEINSSERNLPRLEQRKSDFDKRIAAVQQNWETKLFKAVNKISKSFQKRFTTVASDGQVELVKDERFKNWRLQILVKFRENSDLKILDHQSQSGGERAVSTIFFIMSLQGLTDAPFRVVDEINQGMDPKNEKMAHRYLVHTACKNNNSQYFLVTPKLLTGLYYHPNMAIHCIYTGLYVDSVDKDSTEIDYLDMKRTPLIAGQWMNLWLCTYIYLQHNYKLLIAACNLFWYSCSPNRLIKMGMVTPETPPDNANLTAWKTSFFLRSGNLAKITSILSLKAEPSNSARALRISLVWDESLVLSKTEWSMVLKM